MSKPTKTGKHYRGQRIGGVLVVWVVDGAAEYRLTHHVHHSPSGFECGYSGSGPADLALALAADVIGDEVDTVGIFKGRVGRRAWSVHQALKNEIVSKLTRSHEWVLFAEDLAAGIAEFERVAGELS